MRRNVMKMMAQTAPECLASDDNLEWPSSLLSLFEYSTFGSFRR